MRNGRCNLIFFLSCVGVVLPCGTSQERNFGQLRRRTQSDCAVSVDVSCVPLGTEVQKCFELRPPVDIPCEYTPTAMVLRYNGGSCSAGGTTEPSFISCEDFNGGPPSAKGAKSYLEATDVNGQGILYHADTVAVDRVFAVDGGVFDFEESMKVDIYADETKETLLQSVSFYSDCIQSNLFVRDRFGSLQVASFVNQEQGVVSAFTDALLRFDVTNNGAAVAELSSLSSITTVGTYDLSVAGSTLAVGETTTVNQLVVLDLLERSRYTVMTDANSTANGATCFYRDFISFIVG